MAVITGIRELRGLIELSVDGSVLIRIPKKHFTKLELSEGDIIDCNQLSDRIAQLQFSDAYEAALNVLDRADQASAGLKEKLMRKGYVEAAAQAAIDRLCESGLINDRNYAERIAKTQHSKPVGVYAVRQKLRAKKLSEEDIEAALENFDDTQQAEACRAAAMKLWRKYSSLPLREGKAKLSQALARRGFGWDVIRSAVSSVSDDDEDDEY